MSAFEFYVRCNGCDRTVPESQAFETPVEHGWHVLCRKCWVKHIEELASTPPPPMRLQIAHHGAACDCILCRGLKQAVKGEGGA